MSIVDPNQLGLPACICGRTLVKPHCPNCGSHDVYARSDKHNVSYMNSLTGEMHNDLQTFKCRRCGKFFNEWQWKNECQAPVYMTREKREIEQKALKVQKRIEAIPDSLLGIVNKIRVQRGLGPPLEKLEIPVKEDKDAQ